MKDHRSLYEINVQDRSKFRYFMGLIVRWKQNLKYERARKIARKRGADIGEGVIMYYVWIATNALVLPSCRSVAYGAVIGAGSVVVKNVEAMAVMSGNPAQIIKYRKQVHADLIVESLLGGDYMMYKKVRKKSN